MAVTVRKALCDLVARKDAAVFQSPERFSKEMEKLSGSQADEIKSLAAGLQARLPWDLRRASDPVTLKQMVAVLQGTHQLNFDRAWWTVETWAAALNLTIPPRPAESAPEQKIPVPAPTTLLGIEFSSGTDGLIHVSRVWADTFTERPSSGESLAQAVKHEGAVERSLPISITPVKSASKAAPHATPAPTSDEAAPKAASHAGSPAAAKNTVQKEAAPKASTGQPNPAPTLRGGSAKLSPRVPAANRPSGRPAGQVFFHFSPPGSATSVPVQAPTAFSPRKQPPKASPAKSAPVEKIMGPAGAVPTPTTVEEQFRLGLALFQGLGRQANPAEAVRLLRLAGGKGHTMAGYHLGLALLRGRGTKENPSEAEKWFRWAAEKGSPDAMVQLGSLYQCGYGVPLNIKEARRWFEAAAQQGNTEATELLKHLPA